MNILLNHLLAITSDKVKLRRIVNDIDQERRFQDKRNMREFIKKKCSKRGSRYVRN